jgi:acyl-CoA thioesterase I
MRLSLLSAALLLTMLFLVPARAQQPANLGPPSAAARPAASQQPGPAQSQAPTLAQIAEALEAGQTVRIVAFGDSITGVYYHTGGRRAWADMLTVALTRIYPKARVAMTNAGISGHTSAQGLARLDKDVLTGKPHLVVVMFGMNDAARATRQQFQKNLRAIVRRCRQSGAQVVLCTPNDVYENERRPMARVAEFAQTVREVAVELEVPLADCHRAYAELHEADPTAWMLLMSETIHPSMNGHRLFAEVMAETITGQPVSLAKVQPAPDALRFSLARLRAGQPLSIIAMPPYDRMLPDALRKLFPAAQIEVTPWPGASLAEFQQWGAQIRKRVPQLVVVAVPAGAGAKDEQSFIGTYSWILALSVDFATARWDRVASLPSLTACAETAARQSAASKGAATTQPAARPALSPARAEYLARQIIAGGDCPCLQRRANDTRPAQAIVDEWVQAQAGLIP